MGRQVDSFCKVFCKQHLNACSNLSNLLFSPSHNAVVFFFWGGGVYIKTIQVMCPWDCIMLQ